MTQVAAVLCFSDDDFEVFKDEQKLGQVV